MASTARRRDAGFAIATGAVLAAYNNVLGASRFHDRWYVPLNACATGAGLSLAAAGGLTAGELGLGRRAWRLGRSVSRWTGAAAASWLLVAALPVTRPVLRDKRVAGLDGRAVAYQAAVRIPVGTVLWEEIAFRGVLQAALRRLMPPSAAVVATSMVFGIWHIRPTIQALRANSLGEDRRHAIAGVGAGVAATIAGGALLSSLREQSGGLAAPMALHLVTNSGGAIAAWTVAARDRRKRAD
jgi:uncharacterized protein